MTTEDKNRLISLRESAAKPTIDEQSVEAARDFLEHLKELNRQLRRTLAIEGLCHAGDKR